MRPLTPTSPPWRPSWPVQAEQEEKATDYVALQSLQERQAELEAALEEKMERWVYLNDLAEQISNQ